MPVTQPVSIQDIERLGSQVADDDSPWYIFSIQPFRSFQDKYRIMAVRPDGERVSGCYHIETPPVSNGYLAVLRVTSGLMPLTEYSVNEDPRRRSVPISARSTAEDFVNSAVNGFANLGGGELGVWCMPQSRVPSMLWNIDATVIQEASIPDGELKVEYARRHSAQQALATGYVQQAEAAFGSNDAKSIPVNGPHHKLADWLYGGDRDKMPKWAVAGVRDIGSATKTCILCQGSMPKGVTAHNCGGGGVKTVADYIAFVEWMGWKESDYDDDDLKAVIRRRVTGNKPKAA